MSTHASLLHEKTKAFKEAIVSQFRPEENYGLQVCHDDENAVVDIVFVHGLTGDCQKTWTHQMSGVFWPSDLLANDLPNTRIATFGYDASIISLHHVHHIQDHAMALLDGLAGLRKATHTESRPILFVAHSLGGLVVKDAMISSRENTRARLQKIYAWTYGVCFLGTPHYGSYLANWAHFIFKVIKPVTGTQNPLLRLLRPGSEVQERINNSFSFIVENSNLKLVCFYEKLPMRLIGQIVPKESATIAGHTDIGIEKNHRQMSKFSHNQDKGYRSILVQLSQWIKEIRTNGSQQPHQLVGGQSQWSPLKSIGNNVTQEVNPKQGKIRRRVTVCILSCRGM